MVVCTPVGALLPTSEGRSSRSSSTILGLSRFIRRDPPHKQLSNRHSHPNGLNVMLLLLLFCCTRSRGSPLFHQSRSQFNYS